MTPIIALLVILLGIVLLFISLQGKAEIYFGIGGFIGPIPFGFANNPTMLILTIFLTILVAILYLVWILYH